MRKGNFGKRTPEKVRGRAAKASNAHEAAFEVELQRWFDVGHVFPRLFASKIVCMYQVRVALFLTLLKFIATYLELRAFSLLTSKLKARKFPRAHPAKSLAISRSARLGSAQLYTETKLGKTSCCNCALSRVFVSVSNDKMFNYVNCLTKSIDKSACLKD